MLRTIHTCHYVVIDTLNLVTDIGQSIVDAKRDIRNSPHSASVIDSMCGLQDLGSSHLSLLLRQIVQSLERILNIRPVTEQVLQVFL